jgi:hypothetical protein
VDQGGALSEVTKDHLMNQISRFLDSDVPSKFYPNVRPDRLTIYASCEFPFGRKSVLDLEGNLDIDRGEAKTIPSDWKPEIIAKLQETCRELDKKTSEKNMVMLNLLFHMVDKDGNDIPVFVDGEYKGDLAENTTLIATADSYSEAYKDEASTSECNDSEWIISKH